MLFCANIKILWLILLCPLIFFHCYCWLSAKRYLLVGPEMWQEGRETEARRKWEDKHDPHGTSFLHLLYLWLVPTHSQASSSDQVWEDSGDVQLLGGQGPKCMGLYKLLEQSEVLKDGRHRGSHSCWAQLSPWLSLCPFMPCLAIWMQASHFIIFCKGSGLWCC